MRIKIKKLIKHVKRWNEWRKHSLNSPFSKLLVLFNIIKSPTFECFWTKKEQRDFYEGFMQGIKEVTNEKNQRVF